MFGLIERGRLTMYDATLNQARADAREGTFFHTLGLVAATPLLGEAARLAAGRVGAFQFQSTLGDTVNSIPSALLPSMDAVMAQSIKAPSVGEPQAAYQMAMLLNGLIFVRVVEVRRPGHVPRAHQFRDAALGFMEPLYSAGMKMMMASAS